MSKCHIVGNHISRLILCFIFLSEEILMTNNALWWSPTGKHFLYAVFNDTAVRRYDLTYYGEPSNQYLDNKRLSYPKVSFFLISPLNANRNKSRLLSRLLKCLRSLYDKQYKVVTGFVCEGS